MPLLSPATSLIPARRRYARELYNRFVVQLQQTGCQLVVLAGNHDSVATLNESRDILAFLKTTVVASAGHAPLFCRSATAPRRHILPGPLPAPARAGHQPGRTLQRRKQQLLLNAISDYYQQQYEAACALRGDRPSPIVASGHLTTVGASKSDAVREIYIGTLEAFPASHFPR